MQEVRKEDSELTRMFHKDYSLEAHKVLQYDERRKRLLRQGGGNTYTGESCCVCGKGGTSVKPTTEQSEKKLSEEYMNVGVGLTLLDAIEETFWHGASVGASDWC